MKITKQGARSLRMKMRNVELYFERSYSYLRLAVASGKIVRTGVKVGKTRLLPLVLLLVQERICEQAFNLLIVG